MDQIFRILAINPGSTTTKVAIYENEKEISTKELVHSPEELVQYKYAYEQYGLRKKAILEFVYVLGMDPREITAIAARGGPYSQYKAGAYEIDEAMVEAAKTGVDNIHPIFLSPIIAYDWAQEFGTPAYCYDVVFVDEIEDVARITGTPLVKRMGATHTLNTKAVARKVAEGMGSSYDKVNFIMCHLGGGVSTSLHKQGRIVDVTSKDEGTFSPVRVGRLPGASLIELCYSGKFTYHEMKELIDGKGGLMAHFGTSDCKEIERRINEGDEYAKNVYYAMAYQIAKDIGSLAAVAAGKVDRVVLTGGIAYSKLLTGWIKELTEFIAPVVILPGSFELEALALGVLRVLRGEEKAAKFVPVQSLKK